MEDLDKEVRVALERSGWSQERDIFESIQRPGIATISDAAKRIIRQYGLLRVEYEGKSGEETLYFDVDDSLESKNLRANIFGYDFFHQVPPDELDFNEYLDNDLVEKISENINEPCDYIGFKDDHLGVDLFVTADGSIYSAHGTTADKQASSFTEYLNEIFRLNKK